MGIQRPTESQDEFTMVFYAGVRGSGVGKGSGRAQRLAGEQQRPELLERGSQPLLCMHTMWVASSLQTPGPHTLQM